MGGLVVVLGEALVDLIQPRHGSRDLRMVLGGSPYNVAVGVSRFGADVAYVGAVGNDRLGDELTGFLRSVGVDDRYVIRRKDSRTYLALATLDEGRPSYSYYGEASSFLLETEEVPYELLGRADLVHVGSTVLNTADSRALTRRICQEAPGFVTLDPNPRPVLVDDARSYRRDFEEIVAHCDLVKLSDEDATWLYPRSDSTAVAKRLAGLGPRVAVVTRGPKGVVALADGHEHQCPADTTAKVIDTTGTGDAFMASLLARLAHDLDLDRFIAELPDVLRAAACFAGRVCGAPGGAEAMPTMAEFVDQCPWVSDLDWIREGVQTTSHE